jgi:hypothetical protein
MISPKELEELLKVMVAHGCVVVKHGDLEIHTSPSGPMVAQPPPLTPIVNPFANVSTISDLDQLYGVPQIQENN